MSDILEESKEEKQFFQSEGEESPELLEPKVTELSQTLGEVEESTEEDKTPETEQETEKIPYAPAVETDDGKKMVPQEALGEARRINNKLRQEQNELREKLSRMEQSFTSFQEQTKQKLEPQPKEPSIDENPLEYFQHQNKILSEQLSRISDKQTQQDTANEEQRKINDVNNLISSSVQNYASQNNDYEPALKDYRQARDRQLQFLIPDQAQRSQQILSEETAIAYAAIQQGIDPAEAGYKYFREVSPKTGNGQDQTEVKENVEKIKTISKGQKTSKSVSGSRADPSISEMTLEQFSDLPAERQDEAWDRFINPHSSLFK